MTTLENCMSFLTFPLITGKLVDSAGIYALFKTSECRILSMRCMAACLHQNQKTAGWAAEQNKNQMKLRHLNFNSKSVCRGKTLGTLKGDERCWNFITHILPDCKICVTHSSGDESGNPLSDRLSSKEYKFLGQFLDTWWFGDVNVMLRALSISLHLHQRGVGLVVLAEVHP